MKWVSSVSTAADAEHAVREVVAELGVGPFQLMFVFASVAWRPEWPQILSTLRATFPQVRIVGCSSDGAIGGGREVEGTPALSVTAVQWNDVAMQLFHLPAARVSREDPLASEGIAEDLAIDPDLRPSFVLFGDPFSTDVDVVLADFDDYFEGRPKVGGLASGGTRDGESGLFIDGEVHTAGVVGIAMWGDVELDVVVAQGCRAVGPPQGVTECRAHVVTKLGGSRADAVVESVFSGADVSTRALFEASPMVGVAMNPSGSVDRQGDYLIRPVLGVDHERGAMAIGHVVSEGDVLRFHVRDAQTSSDELTELMARHAASRVSDPPCGVLLMSCLGRGRSLYGHEGHDSQIVRRAVGDVAIGGFFCNGEIGPVHQRSWLHSYTAVVALFRRPEWN